jgi:hypothetical protein
MHLSIDNSLDTEFSCARTSSIIVSLLAQIQLNKYLFEFIRAPL